MKKVYDRIVDMRGNLITVIAKGSALASSRESRSKWTDHLCICASHRRRKVTLQCFENTRGISTNDRVTF